MNMEFSITLNFKKIYFIKRYLCRLFDFMSHVRKNSESSICHFKGEKSHNISNCLRVNTLVSCQLYVHKVVGVFEGGTLQNQLRR